jgi:hypothetical protein
MEHVAMARPCCWDAGDVQSPQRGTGTSPGGVAAVLCQSHGGLQRPRPIGGDRLSSLGDDVDRSEHPHHERP